MGRRVPAPKDDAQGPPGSCPVCRIVPEHGSRMSHLRQEHPAYWRSFLVRVGSPWIFLAIMFGLAATHADGWTFVGVLIGFLGLSLWARYQSASARAQRGLGLSGGQWVRGVGIGLMLMSVAFSAVALLLRLLR